MVQEFDPFAELFDTEDLSEESVHDGSVSVAKIGWYHVQIVSREYHAALDSDADFGPKLPHVALKMRILAGTESSEIDKTIYHTLWLANWEDKSAGEMAPLSSRNLKSLLAFFHAFGTVGPNVFGQTRVKLSHSLHSNLEDTVAIVKVSLERNERGAMDPSGKLYPDRYKIQWNNDAYPTDHPRCEHVPKNPDFANYNSSSVDEDVFGL